MKNVTLIPGDGIGPEIMETVVRVVNATGVKIEWHTKEAGIHALKKYGSPLPEEVIQCIREDKVAIKGPVTTPIGTGFRSVNVALRKELDLYASLRPCKSILGIPSRFKNIDLIIIRENTEDLYAGIEWPIGSPEIKALNRILKVKIREDAAVSVKPISRTGSARIVRFAFEFALKNRRHKVTAVSKANVLKYTDGLFLEVAREIAQEYKSKIEYEEQLVDNMAVQLLIRPEHYDVIVLPNLYGDILSDLTSALVGGLGVTPGANYGEEIALFEAVHGSAPDLAGKNKVNPTACILSAKMMLDHIGEKTAAARLQKAVEKIIAEGKSVTFDLKAGPEDPTAVGTREMGDAIIAELGVGG